MENYPIFPDYSLEQVEDNIMTLNSNIHIHKDFEEIVKVYTYLVSNTYVVNTKEEKKMAIKNHLKDTFIKAKYFNTDTFDTTLLPLVTVLDKRADDFLQKLHFDYT
jgi:hypothetical protein